jgi:hypothetical protein
MRNNNVIDLVRAWVARRLGERDVRATDGSWWEIDLIIVILLGSGIAGVAGLIKL